MKNIIILGPSRVGKSSLSSLLCKKFNFSYISGDSIRNAFMNIYPELGYNTKNTINKDEFCKFINWIVNENNIHLKRDVYYVIDSTDISIKNALAYFENSLIILLGSKDITPEVMANNMKKYDVELDWTYGYSEKELLEISNEIIMKSNEIYKESLENNILYFDTSSNRNEIYNAIINKIEKEMGINNYE